MEHSHQYFKNQDCQYFPCHQGMEGEEFNCLFCYCPMNPYADCLGKPRYIKHSNDKIIKDCSGCTFPHEPRNYQQIVDFLKKKLNGSCT